MESKRSEEVKRVDWREEEKKRRREELREERSGEKRGNERKGEREIVERCCYMLQSFTTNSSLAHL